MLSLYIDYPMARISKHFDTSCDQIRKKNKMHQRLIQIDATSVESELNKMRRKDLKFASSAGLNDVWIRISLGDISAEDNLVKTIQEILGKYYKPLARAEIKTHCPDPVGPRIDSEERTGLTSELSKHRVIVGKKGIPNREKKIESILNIITSGIEKFSSLYRRGPSLYFYKRILDLRKKHPKINTFLTDNYCLEILYATLISWDMNSRGAKLKYYDDFKDSVILCLPEFEEIESITETSSIAEPKQIIELLGRAYPKLALMETRGRIVSNSKCLHFLFPLLFIPIDKTNTLDYLYGNDYESPKRFLDIIEFFFEIMQKPVDFDRYQDDTWNQNLPKIIDNAIILLNERSLISNKGKLSNTIIRVLE